MSAENNANNSSVGSNPNSSGVLHSSSNANLSVAGGSNLAVPSNPSMRSLASANSLAAGGSTNSLTGSQSNVTLVAPRRGNRPRRPPSGSTAAGPTAGGGPEKPADGTIAGADGRPVPVTFRTQSKTDTHFICSPKDFGTEETFLEVCEAEAAPTFFSAEARADPSGTGCGLKGNWIHSGVPHSLHLAEEGGNVSSGSNLPWLCRAIPGADQAAGTLAVNEAVLQNNKRAAELMKKRAQARTLTFEQAQSRHGLSHLELSFRDAFVSRSDMLLVIESMRGRVLFLGDHVEYEGTDFTVTSMLRTPPPQATTGSPKKQGTQAEGNGATVAPDDGPFPVMCGMVTEDSLISFESISFVCTILVQISSDMWSSMPDGRIALDWMLDAFLRDFAKKVLSHRTQPKFRVIYFGRLAVNDRRDFLHSFILNRHGNNIEDLSNESRAQLTLLMTNLSHHIGDLHPTQAFTSARDSNVLETINLVLDRYSFHHVDRRLDLTGQALTVVTGGKGVFSVSNELSQLTAMRMLDNAIRHCVFVCIGRPPLHRVPLLEFIGTDKALQVQRSLKLERDRIYYESPFWAKCLFYCSRSFESDRMPTLQLLTQKEWLAWCKQSPGFYGGISLPPAEGPIDPLAAANSKNMYLSVNVGSPNAPNPQHRKHAPFPDAPNARHSLGVHSGNNALYSRPLVVDAGEAYSYVGGSLVRRGMSSVSFNSMKTKSLDTRRTPSTRNFRSSSHQARGGGSDSSDVMHGQLTSNNSVAMGFKGLRPPFVEAAWFTRLSTAPTTTKVADEKKSATTAAGAVALAHSRDPQHLALGEYILDSDVQGGSLELQLTIANLSDSSVDLQWREELATDGPLFMSLLKCFVADDKALLAEFVGTIDRPQPADIGPRTLKLRQMRGTNRLRLHGEASVKLQLDESFFLVQRVSLGIPIAGHNGGDSGRPHQDSGEDSLSKLLDNEFNTCPLIATVVPKHTIIFSLQPCNPYLADVPQESSPTDLAPSGPFLQEANRNDEHTSRRAFEQRWGRMHPLPQGRIDNWRLLCRCPLMPIYAFGIEKAAVVSSTDDAFNEAPHPVEPHHAVTLHELVLQRLHQGYQLVSFSSHEAVMTIGHQHHVLKLEPDGKMNVVRKLHRGVYGVEKGGVLHDYSMWNSICSTFEPQQATFLSQLGPGASFPWNVMDSKLGGREFCSAEEGFNSRQLAFAIIAAGGSGPVAHATFDEFLTSRFSKLLVPEKEIVWGHDDTELTFECCQPGVTDAPRALNNVMLYQPDNLAPRANGFDKTTGKTITEPEAARKQHVEISLSAVYNPRCAFTLTLSWLVCSAPLVKDWVASIKATAQRSGLLVVGVPCEYDITVTNQLKAVSRIPNPEPDFRVALLKALVEELGYIPDNPIVHSRCRLLHKSAMSYVISLPEGIHWGENFMHSTGQLEHVRQYREFVELSERIRNQLPFLVPPSPMSGNPADPNAGSAGGFSAPMYDSLSAASSLNEAYHQRSQ